MARQQKSERTRVLIVEQDWDFGIKLADWLAAHSYQPVLVRSVDAAIDELSSIRPQAICVGLRTSELRSQIETAEVLLLMQLVCPRAPIITIADEARDDLPPAVLRQGAHRFLVKPIEFSQIGQMLQSELVAATV